MTPARSQIAGQSLEDLLDFAHLLYLNRGEAWVKHNEIRGRFRSRGGGKAEFTPSPAKGAPDYYGCVDGRMIAFDAKSTGNKKTWMLDGRRVHQYLDLCEIAVAGGVCWFAVEHRLSQILYLARVQPPFPDTEFMQRVPKLDFSRDVLPSNVITVAYEEGYYDWLSVVRANWFTPDGLNSQLEAMRDAQAPA